jgi:hypothetical protein
LPASGVDTCTVGMHAACKHHDAAVFVQHAAASTLRPDASLLLPRLLAANQQGQPAEPPPAGEPAARTPGLSNFMTLSMCVTLRMWKSSAGSTQKPEPLLGSRLCAHAYVSRSRQESSAQGRTRACVPQRVRGA